MTPAVDRSGELEARIERASRWLRRARLDHRGVKLMMPSPRAGERHPEDPALVVLLLQQAVEKAVKAVYIATGGDERRMATEHGHASLGVYPAGVMRFTGSQASRPVLESFFNIPGYSKVPLVRLLNQLEHQHKRSAKTTLSIDLQREWAACSEDVVRTMCERFTGLRSAFNSFINQTLRSKQVTFDLPRLLLNTESEAISDVGKQITGHQMSAEQVSAAATMFTKLWGGLGPDMQQELTGLPPVRLRQGDRRRFREQTRDAFMGVWAQMTLMVLAALTFPHAISCRYPAPPQAPADPVEAAKTGKLGSDLYQPPLGIVVALPELVVLAGLVLDSLSPVIEGAAGYSVMASAER